MIPALIVQLDHVHTVINANVTCVTQMKKTVLVVMMENLVFHEMG